MHDWQDWRYFNDNRADHNLPLEPGTRIQLGLGQAMTSVELIAANKLRGWAFKFMSDLFADEVTHHSFECRTPAKRLPQRLRVHHRLTSSPPQRWVC